MKWLWIPMLGSPYALGPCPKPQQVCHLCLTEPTPLLADVFEAIITLMGPMIGKPRCFLSLSTY